MVDSAESRNRAPSPAAILILAESAGVELSIERATALSSQAAPYLAALNTVSAGNARETEPAAEFRLDQTEARR